MLIFVYLSTDSETQYAADVINNIKSWAKFALYKALHHSRTEMEKQEILQQYFLEMEGVIKRNPMDYVLDHIYYAITIVKE